MPDRGFEIERAILIAAYSIQCLLAVASIWIAGRPNRVAPAPEPNPENTKLAVIPQNAARSPRPVTPPLRPVTPPLLQNGSSRAVNIPPPPPPPPPPSRPTTPGSTRVIVVHSGSTRQITPPPPDPASPRLPPHPPAFHHTTSNGGSARAIAHAGSQRAITPPLHSPRASAQPVIPPRQIEERTFPYFGRRIALIAALIGLIQSMDVNSVFGIWSPFATAQIAAINEAFIAVGGSQFVYFSAGAVYKQLHRPIPLSFTVGLAVTPIAFLLHQTAWLVAWQVTAEQRWVAFNSLSVVAEAVVYAILLRITLSSLQSQLETFVAGTGSSAVSTTPRVSTPGTTALHSSSGLDVSHITAAISRLRTIWRWYLLFVALVIIGFGRLALNVMLNQWDEPRVSPSPDIAYHTNLLAAAIGLFVVIGLLLFISWPPAPVVKPTHTTAHPIAAGASVIIPLTPTGAAAAGARTSQVQPQPPPPPFNHAESGRRGSAGSTVMIAPRPIKLQPPAMVHAPSGSAALAAALIAASPKENV